jgi:hypothetical protein
MCANLRVILVTNTVKVMNEKDPDYERTRNEKWTNLKRKQDTEQSQTKKEITKLKKQKRNKQ